MFLLIYTLILGTNKRLLYSESEDDARAMLVKVLSVAIPAWNSVLYSYRAAEHFST